MVHYYTCQIAIIVWKWIMNYINKKSLLYIKSRSMICVTWIKQVHKSNNQLIPYYNRSLFNKKKIITEADSDWIMYSNKKRLCVTYLLYSQSKPFWTLLNILCSFCSWEAYHFEHKFVEIMHNIACSFTSICISISIFHHCVRWSYLEIICNNTTCNINAFGSARQLRSEVIVNEGWFSW